jgi:hypothetical protein
MKDHIEIGPITYNIKIQKTVSSPHGTPLFGQVSYDEGLIELLKNQNPDMLQITLWHEIIHALFFQYGVSQDDTLKISREQLIDILATGIHDVLKRNPWLTDRDS